MKWFCFVLVALASAALSARFLLLHPTQVSEQTKMSVETPILGLKDASRLGIHGVRLGMSRDAVHAKLPDADIVEDCCFEYRGVHADCTDGRVVLVCGNNLECDEREVLGYARTSQDAVQKVLGLPDIVGETGCASFPNAAFRYSKLGLTVSFGTEEDSGPTYTLCRKNDVRPRGSQ